MAQTELENTLAQSLMAIGLYTVAFESMVLCFRAKVFEYLTEHSANDLKPFHKACKTAFQTFEFCGPRLVAFAVISQTELDCLTAIRERRNLFAHEGYNHLFELTLPEIDDDVRQMHVITSKVDRWDVPRLTPRILPQTVQFTISPAFVTGFVRQIAQQLAYDRLRTEPTANA